MCASKHTYERIVVIGPSHHVYVEGASLSGIDTHETPCGELTIDRTFANTLKRSFAFLTHVPQAHAEHSTENSNAFYPALLSTPKSSKSCMENSQAQSFQR